FIVIPFLRKRCTRKNRARENITVSIILIENNPHLFDFISFFFHLEQRLAKRHIIPGFVYKPPALAVYDKTSGKRTFGEHYLSRIARFCRRYCRKPPRFFHVTRVCFQSVFGNEYSVSFISFRAQTVVILQNRGLEFLTHR